MTSKTTLFSRRNTEYDAIVDFSLDHILLFFYIITMGFTSAALVLSLLYWMLKKNPGRFHTFIFILYLTLLLLLGGIQFYWGELFAGGQVLKIAIGLAEFLGYALLLYFLPATVNHIAHRPWTPFRLSASITAGTTYFILGTVYLFTGFLETLAWTSSLLYIISLTVILANIARGINHIKKITIRATVLLITLLSFAFLPLVMLGHLLDGSGKIWEINLSLRFLFLTMYYFLMALAGIVFYLRAITDKTYRNISDNRAISNLPLTKREKSIAQYIVRGQNYTEIAEDLDISPNTVRNHVANLYKKLAIRSRFELIHILRGKTFL